MELSEQKAEDGHFSAPEREVSSIGGQWWCLWMAMTGKATDQENACEMRSASREEPIRYIPV